MALERESERKMKIIEELTRNREQVMQKTRATVMERQKLIFLNKDLMTEHRQFVNGTG